MALLGKQGDAVFSFALDIRGVNNADTYIFLNATVRSEYKSLSLYFLAKELELKQKMTMPQQNNVRELIEYCMGDSEVAVQLWQKTGLEQKISSCR